MRRYVVREHDPGPSCRSDDDLMDFLRMRGGIAYHPVGTCKMGNDAAAVVDARLRVRGLQGAARGGRLHHADARIGQHLRADGHDRGERRGHDSRGHGSA